MFNETARLEGEGLVRSKMTLFREYSYVLKNNMFFMSCINSCQLFERLLPTLKTSIKGRGGGSYRMNKVFLLSFSLIFFFQLLPTTLFSIALRNSYVTLRDKGIRATVGSQSKRWCHL